MSALNIEPAYLERAAAASFLGISESTLEKLVREDDAPKPRQVSPKRVAWLVRELRAWAEARPVSNLLPPENTNRHQKIGGSSNEDRRTSMSRL